MSDSMDKLEQYLLEQGQIDEADTRLLREVAYDRLQEAIKLTDLQPGDPLSETRISKALGISRTPVREALQRLSKEGLVQVIPGRAVTVAAPSIQDVLDAIHVRELLEPELVRLAAEALSDEDRTLLAELTEQMVVAANQGDRATWSRIDTKWHGLLSDSCPNHLLGQLVLQARNRVYNESTSDRVSSRYLIDGTMEHKAIVEAILARDSRKASDLMIAHLKNVRTNMFKRLVPY